MNCYTTLRKRREEFRCNLVKMLILQENEDDPMSKANEEGIINKKAEENLLKYYYYIMHGIDDVHVAPMDVNLLDKILNLVPSHWQKRFQNILRNVIDDAKEHYAMSLKKSIVDFVLQDPVNDALAICDEQVIVFYPRINYFKL